MFKENGEEVNRSDQPGNSRSARRDHTGDLEVGRVVVARPKFGQLELYVKRDGAQGATFYAEEDGSKYGAAPGVKKLFEIGRYEGWAYVDTARHLAFRFVEGVRESPPHPLFSLRAPDGWVNVPHHLAAEAKIEEGMWVAFYSRDFSHGENGIARIAAKLFPVGPEKPRLVAWLLAGELPKGEVVPLVTGFLRTLREKRNEMLEADTQGVKLALEAIAGGAAVDEELRQWALAELSKFPASRALAQAGTSRVTKPHESEVGQRDEGNPKPLAVQRVNLL